MKDSIVNNRPLYALVAPYFTVLWRLALSIGLLGLAMAISQLG